VPAEDLAAVERACTELAASGRPITFKEVAARVGTSRTTLYRRGDLRALVEEQRSKGRGASTLTGLAVQIDQLRYSLEAVAGRVREHEERLRHLERRGKGPK
jgi:DNA-binding Lrp family transcriptional regulator